MKQIKQAGRANEKATDPMIRRKISIEIFRDLFAVAVLLASMVVVLIVLGRTLTPL